MPLKDADVRLIERDGGSVMVGPTGPLSVGKIPPVYGGLFVTLLASGGLMCSLM